MTAIAGPLMMAFAFVGLVAALRASTRGEADRRTRLAWRMVAGAFILLLATLALFLEPDAKTSFPAPADGTRLGFVLLLFLAAQSFPLRSVTGIERRKSIYDSLTVVIGGSMLLWYLVVGPYMDTRGTSPTVVAAASVYPVADLVLMFGFVRVLLRGANSSARRPVGLLALGILFLIASDTYVGYMQAHTTEVFRTSVWQLTCLLSMHFLLAVAAVDQCRRLPGPAADAVRPHGIVASKLPYAAIGVGYALMIIAALRVNDTFPWSGLVAGGLGITCLVVLRQVAVQRESNVVASTDGLTGLANRSRFHEVLARTLDRDGRNGSHTAVLLLDLNGFKQVNDTLGHKVGDRLLADFGRMLTGSVLGSDIVGRLGGDEFAVILHDIRAMGNAEAVARRIVDAAAEPVVIDGATVQASASIGIALSGPDELGPDEILHRADVAMYRAKRQGVSASWMCYDESMGAGDGPSLEDELGSAVAAGQLRVFYQPIVTLPEGELTGVEALVRWQHPRRGLLAPDEFISIAERSGTIDELGRWVLEQACSQVATWQRTLPDTVSLQLNVNVSPRQLDDQGFSADVLAVVQATGLDPRQLVLEITENALIGDEIPAGQLAALSAAGIRIALDDFGTGHSSLRYLTILPIDMLKIDRGFVATLDGTPEGAAVAQAVLRLAQVLRLDAIAEGVETEAQARELTLLGCGKAQGYHFARPMAADRIVALIEGQRDGFDQAVEGRTR